MANFDKFYTKPEVAQKCVDFLKTFVDIRTYFMFSCPERRAASS